MRNIVNKACSVFLQVHLVVDLLLQGIVNADRMSDLQTRLDTLPSGIEELFDKLLNKLEPIYLEHACQLFRLLHAHIYPPLLAFSFADGDDVHSAVHAKMRSLSANDLEDRAEETRRRLNSRCIGLLEIYEPLRAQDRDNLGKSVRIALRDPNNQTSVSILEHVKVRYLHRTAQDFLESPPIWNKILKVTGGDDFDTNTRWANRFLQYLKMLRLHVAVQFALYNSIEDYNRTIQDPLTWCTKYALRLEKKDNTVRLTYLKEAS